MSEVIEIYARQMRAALAPALGGAVMRLSCGGRDVLRPAASLEEVASDPRAAACYPMVPWFSRLPGGLNFAGCHYDLASTLPVCDPDHALHGHGWVSPWTVIDRTEDRLSCAFAHAPAPLSFPFPFRAVQEFSVSETAFRIGLSVTNTGARPMPAGLGLHPFFPRGASAAAVFKGERLTFAGNPMDDSYPQWGGSARLEAAAMTLGLASDAPILHVYAPKDEPFFCAEPVTHLPGRFGEEILHPGETLNLFLKIFIIEPKP